MRTLFTRTLAAAAVFAAPLLFSCAAAGEEDMIQFTPGGVPYVIELQDHSVRANLAIVQVDSGNQGDLPIATVEVRNTGAAEFRFRADFTWTDSDGRELISPANASRTIHLMPGASTTLQSAAASPEAYRFKLQLRSEN
ncbi:MAG: DUF1425 domain-containing protein [Planctomycetota bacterium]|nr:MAG: DUF1425 domain-containing protein [Planctomycetota bacterium]